MLLCSQCVVHDSLLNITTALTGHRPGSGRVVIYAQDEWSGELALACIQAGANDYLVPNYSLADLARHITCAFQGKSPYAIYKGVTKLAPGDQVFVAMPYDYDGLQQYDLGVAVALRYLKLNPVLASDELRTDFLRVEVHRQIDDSRLLIANISQYNRKGVNPNVAEEAQYAEDKGIPRLLIRCLDPLKGGRKQVPADLQGILRLDYHTCADLALKLYFGLSPYLGTP
jgi:hypothetical protein